MTPMTRITAIVFLILTAACAHRPPVSLDEYANHYVKLALALGEQSAALGDAWADGDLLAVAARALAIAALVLPILGGAS